MKKRSNVQFNPKQKHIMRTALEIFSQKGYNGSSVRDIAMASNVNLAMINYYFGSKLQLLEAIFEQMTELSKSHIDSYIFDESLAPIEKLEKIIDGYTHFAIENSDFMILLMRQQLSAGNDKIDEFIFSLKFRYWRIFHSALEEAKKAKFFNQDANIVTITSIVMGAMNYLISDRNFISKAKGIKYEEDQKYYLEVIQVTMDNIKTILHGYLLDEKK